MSAFRARIIMPLAMSAIVGVSCSLHSAAGPVSIATTTASPSGSDGDATAPPDCANFVVATEDFPRTLYNWSLTADVIVVGRYLREDEGFWDTEKGARPEIDDPSNAVPGIRTPVEIDIEQAVRGRVETRVTVRGGQIGCDHISWRSNPALAGGTKYVLFLMNVTLRSGERVVTIGDAWPIDRSETVESPLEGPLKLDDLVRGLSPGSPPLTPEPTIPDDDVSGEG